MSLALLRRQLRGKQSKRKGLRVPIYGASGVVGHAVIDEADAHIVGERRLHQHCKSGAIWFHVKTASGKWQPQYLHRAIMGAPRGLDVDHINHDRRDNRRCNLRICTHAQNMMNLVGQASASGVRGVRLNPNGRKWCATINHGGALHHLGSFPSKGEAAAARRRAEIRLRGEFAPPEIACI